MKFVQLKSIKDIVMLVASSPASNVVQHMGIGGGHLYFVIGGTLSEVFLYFVKTAEPLSGSFITYNSYTGDIGFSERVLSEPNVNTFPVIEIQNQDLLPAEMLAKVGKL
jgi:hypothetical protein